MKFSLEIAPSFGSIVYLQIILFEKRAKPTKCKIILDRLVLFTSDRPRHLFTRSIPNNKPEIPRTKILAVGIPKDINSRITTIFDRQFARSGCCIDRARDFDSPCRLRVRDISVNYVSRDGVYRDPTVLFYRVLLISFSNFQLLGENLVVGSFDITFSHAVDFQ
jgi:hypothetical protein